MRTAGISGASEDVGAPALSLAKQNVSPVLGRLLSLVRQNPLPRSTHGTIAAIAVLLCTVISADVAISEFNAQSRVELAARMAAAGLENVEPEAMEEVFAPITRAIGAEFGITVTDRDGKPVLSNLATDAGGTVLFLPEARATRSVAGPLGAVETRLQQDAILQPVAWRGLIVLFVAGLIGAAVVRRTGRSDAAERARALHDALALTSDGLVIWDGSQRLVASSDTLDAAALVPPALLKRGISYAAFLGGLRDAGELTLLATGKTGRRLRLALPNEETWELQESLSGDGLLVTHLSNESERARLRSEVARLRNRLGEMASEVQTQRVRGDAASRSKTLFLGQLSHSLRTPLNHIIGFADLLRHQSYGPLGDPRYLSYAANIKQSGEALLDMLSNMLELAEFDSGQRMLNKEPIHLDELFDWTEGRYGEQAKRAGIKIVVERAADMVIVGDRLCLRRLIGNIVDNSLKYTPAGGSLTLAAWPSDDGVVLEFTDTGIGIAADTLTVLNTSFALNTDSRGNGIAIARAIAELSGGQLQINSSPGVGTTVAVVLPVKTAAKSGKIRRVA